jgi:hypothetical protein
MHIYYFKAIIIFYNIKGNKNIFLNQLKLNFIIFLLLNLHQNYIEALQKHQIKFKNLYFKKKNYIYFKIDVFYLNQFSHNFSHFNKI